jgi:hypothetical protein
MVRFETKNPNLGKFWRFLQLKMLVYLWTFGKFCVNFPVLVFCTKKNLANLYWKRRIFLEWIFCETEWKNGWENGFRCQRKGWLKRVELATINPTPDKKFLCPILLFLPSTYKQCILSHFKHNSTATYMYVSRKPYALAGFEPGYSGFWGGCDVHCATPPPFSAETLHPADFALCKAVAFLRIEDRLNVLEGNIKINLQDKRKRTCVRHWRV